MLVNSRIMWHPIPRAEVIQSERNSIMKYGKWYLVYIEFDDMENNISDAVRQEKLSLNSADEDCVADEARNLWEQKLAKGTYKGWDGKVYPNSPRVSYEFSL